MPGFFVGITFIDSGPTQRLGEFVEWTRRHITGDEKGEAQILLDRLMKAFGQRDLLETSGTAEYRVRKKSENRTGITFADYVWKPIVLIEMKKRGTDLARHFRQAFDYWVHLVPNRPASTVLCNFDEFWIYDFNESLEDLPRDKSDQLGVVGQAGRRPRRAAVVSGV